MTIYSHWRLTNFTSKLNSVWLLWSDFSLSFIFTSILKSVSPAGNNSINPPLYNKTLRNEAKEEKNRAEHFYHKSNMNTFLPSGESNLSILTIVNMVSCMPTKYHAHKNRWNLPLFSISLMITWTLLWIISLPVLWNRTDLLLWILIIWKPGLGQEKGKKIRLRTAKSSERVERILLGGLRDSYNITQSNM